MAFGRNNSEQNSNLVFLTPKGKVGGKEIDPVFYARKKIDGKYEDIKPESAFSGTLVKIEHKVATPPAPAQPFDLIVYTVDDEENRYICEFTFKNATRSLFNRTLSLESFEGLEISYFRNDAGFENLGLTQNKQRLKAKYEKGEYPEVTVITNPKTGKEVSKDYEEVNTFFKEKMIELGEKLKGVTPKAATPVQKPQVVEDQEVPTGMDEDDSSIPF